MSNVHGLFSNRNNDDSEEEDENSRFVGGIDSRGGGSGLAVEPNFDQPGSNRDSLFQLAEQAGSEDATGEVRRTITMYRDGFVVDDGPYRRLDDPNNGDFLRALAMGRTPAELMQGSDGGNITVGLVDKRQEDYVEQFQSFSGAGATLGASAAVTGSTVDPNNLPEAQPLDSSRAATSIQVRLPNGKRQVLKVNLDIPVLQLAAQVCPLLDDSSQSFQLISGFPPKPIENFEETIEGAGLKGAQVQLKLV
eukprot:Nitzschia sp. Nitz4//scaffold12_size214221//41303//42149//NITZ4_001485-RA/size214221-augustus-gene-0.24-mRNA-1//-1//CDS//3329534975//7800//frame0